MFDDLFFERLTKLRLQKGVSARDMSLSLGQTAGYINKIENKKSLPSLHGFFFICEYLNVHPKDFFNDEFEYPVKMQDVIQDLSKLNEDQLLHVSALVKGLLR